ncbi:Membrane protein [Operophtera brumata]|uniref:Membrane protein n=1 Tax=Operophtera brumata TaxID=104452 RepID=A0A0L7L6C4_OPEBR|nr:Membrane protein [Operophtera brumata]
MVMKIIAIMVRLTSIGGGFVQLTASDDTARAQRRQLATSHDHPPPPGTTTRGHHDFIERLQHERAVSGRTRSEARAPAPPPSDKPGATPPGDAYAPHGADTPVHRTHHPSTPDTFAAAATVVVDPARQAPVHYAPHLRQIAQSQRASTQKIKNFRLLKKTRKQNLQLQNHGGSPDTDENNEAQTNTEPF